jgi:uncharacterized protein
MELTILLAAGTSAFVTGATGSVHCALMCGPLACAGMGRERTVGSVAGWHVGRITAYVLMGALLGAVGRGLSATLVSSVQRVLPWMMAAGLLIAAFDLSKRVGPVPFLGRGAKALVRLAGQVDPTMRSFLLGLATPLLPCGLLYGLFLAAVASASALSGGLLLGAFALGALPAVLTVQLGMQRVTVSPRVSFVLRRVVPMAAAVVLVARALLMRPDVAQCG